MAAASPTSWRTELIGVENKVRMRAAVLMGQARWFGRAEWNRERLSG